MRVVYYEGNFEISVYDSEEHQKTLTGKIFDGISDNKILVISFDDNKKDSLIIDPTSSHSWESIQSLHLILSDEQHSEIFSQGKYTTAIENYSFNFSLQH